MYAKILRLTRFFILSGFILINLKSFANSKADLSLSRNLENRITYSSYRNNLHSNLAVLSMDISGRIVDENGAGMPGVSVKVKGTKIVTITDGNGNFTLKNIDEDAILVITYVGYASREVKAKNTLKIELTPDNNELTEVVVVGYGAQKKVSVTAAISTVSNKQLLQTPVANITNSLVGRMPGLVAQQTSGQPGLDASNLIIRGRATTNSAAPLVLIDGVERPLGSVSPYEVESVSILKDASATAVYGVRGANGVILVTTKRGVEGKTNVSVTFNSALQEVTRMPNFLNSYDFAVLLNEGLKNENRAPKYDQAALDAYKNHTDPYLYPDVDYKEEFIRPFAPQQTLNANVSGGSKFAKYFVSTGFLKQAGILDRTDEKSVDQSVNYTRFNFRSNVDLDITKNLTAKVNLALRSETNNTPRGGISRLFSLLMRTPPNNGPLQNPDGSYGAGPDLTDNVLAEFSDQGFTKEYTNLMEGSVDVKYDLSDIVKGLSLRSKLAFTNHYKQQISRYKGTSQYNFYTSYKLTGKDADGNYIYGPRIGADNPIYNYFQSFVTDADNGYRDLYFEGALDYKRSFDKHNVTGLVLFQRSRKTLNRAANPYDWPFSYQGIVGRLGYNWNERYMAEVNMGYNGSEQFPPGSKYGFFPSVSAGWVVTNEPFMENVKGVLSFLKFRGSYGLVGNDKINAATRFFYLDNVYTNSGGYAFGLNNNLNPGGILEGAFGNKFIQWEKAKKANLAVETKFFKDRLGISVELFRERRNNILTAPGTIPLTVGTGVPTLNIGEVENKGYEVNIDFNSAIGEFKYYINSNVTYARNKVVFRDEPERKYPWLRETGQSTDVFRGFETAGFFNSQAEIDGWAKTSFSPGPLGKLQPGDFKYVDQNGDGIIDNFDRVVIRKPSLPRYVFGFTLGGSFKGFDFSAMLQGATEASMAVSLEAAYEFFNTGKVMDIHLDRWTPQTASTATYPRLSSAPGTGDHNYQQNDYWVKDASYLRLKQAEIGYTFSPEFLQKIKVSTLRVYLNGSNLYTWSAIKYLDPENRNSRAWYYPQQRVWAAGVNINF